MQITPAQKRPAGAAMLAALMVAALVGEARADRVPRVHALVGARIVVAPGTIIESGTLVIRDGLIESVGAGVEAPDDARVWELEELTLYPGLIESLHLLDWPEPEEDETPHGGHPNVLVRPERDMLLYAGQEKAVEKLRQAGFTTAVFAPKQGLFRGSSIVRNLGDNLHASLLERDRAQHLRLVGTDGFDGGYPTSTMGAVALLRQTLLDARHHGAAHAVFAKNPRQQRPAYSTALAALEDAAGGRQPVVMESNDIDDTLRLGRLAEEFSLDATIVGTGTEYQRLDEIAATGRPLILPVAFPKAPEVKEKDDWSVDLDTLRAWYWAPHNPRLLSEAGVDFVLTSHRLSEPKKLHEMAAEAIDRGLSEEQLLAALTTKPAARLGLTERAGTLEAGKMANIVVADGDIFTAETTIRSLWIDGDRFEIKKIEPPTVDPLGTWTVTVDTGDGTMTVQLTLTGSVEELDGLIGTPMGSLPLSDAYVSADTVEIALDSTPLGMPGSITLSMSIDGDSASGPGTSPQGPFTFTAERTARPDDDDPETSLLTDSGALK